MGGMASGRRRWSKRRVTEDYVRIDVRAWNRTGRLAPGHRFLHTWTRYGEKIMSAAVQCTVDHLDIRCEWDDPEGKPASSESRILLDRTACHFGGERVWFRCPAGCTRSVAVLYWHGTFGCQRCQNLAYRSQRESLQGRSRRRTNTIWQRLQWPDGVPQGRPKGMHRRTYIMLLKRHNAAIQPWIDRIGAAERELNWIDRAIARVQAQIDAGMRTAAQEDA
jgi:hypothetical protein